jgi:hypothetical protein
LGYGDRGKLGVCDVPGGGGGGADGMRDDSLGVADIRELPGDTRGSGDTASGDDGRGAGRECDTGMVGGLERRGELGA